MFKGFQTVLPEYEVYTPQTNNFYNVRSLNVREEERLKGSLLSNTQINDHLNKCIFDSLTKKPENITSYESFLKNTTLKDRDALLYGLYHITYEEIRNYDVFCSSCTKKYSVTVQASSTFNINPYPTDELGDILQKKVDFTLPITKTVTVTLKQPTLFDENVALKSMGIIAGVNLDVLTESLIIDKFQENPSSGDSVVYTDRQDIIDAYSSLPAKDKREIFKKYRENFGQYGISLKMLATCTHCGTQEDINIDLVDNFFRQLHSI